MQQHERVVGQVCGLTKLSYDELKERWRMLFGKEPPAYNRAFIISRLAYRIQELTYGGLSEDTKQKMQNALRAGGFNETGGRAVKGKSGKGCSQKADAPVVGTRLIRDWNGRRYEVIAVPGGFEYDGRLYRSLTAIAKAITGTHWNGRLFFGLTRNTNGKAAKSR